MRARRRGGVPPIVTVLITISAVVAAGLVAWFLFTTTNAAVKRPVLEVVSAYYVGGTLKVTLRNVGAVTAKDLSVTGVTCASGASSSSGVSVGNIDPGQSAVASITVSELKDGDSCVMDVTYSVSGTTSTESLAFKVVRP
ncbi:MAG: hypothetical protein LM580_07720 [Thermofilum sp.]|nr:hypothetical protein [Thermofilum sp.]